MIVQVPINKNRKKFKVFKLNLCIQDIYNMFFKKFDSSLL